MYGYEVFHEDTAAALLEAVRSGRNPHAWIFSGNEGLGRHSVAGLVASAVACGENTAPCGVCQSCVMAKAETHPDIKKVIPQEKKKTIGVDDIRNLNEDVYIKPFFSEHKIYIIEGDLLTVEAQNAFLKTLEEPPAYAVFIIIVSDAEKLLPTVRSRCATVKFPPLSPEKMRQYLHDKYPELEHSYDFYIGFSYGNPGRADSLINSGEFDILRSSCFDTALKILSTKTEDAFSVSEFFDKNKENIDNILEILLLFFRDALFICNGYGDKIINIDYRDRLSGMSAYSDKLTVAIEKISVCSEMHTRNTSVKQIGAYLALSVKKSEE